MNNQITPRRGLQFLHSRVLSTEAFDGKTPQRFVVTKIAQGTVYYRPVYGCLARGERQWLGNPGCCPVGEFGRWAKQIIV